MKSVLQVLLLLGAVAGAGPDAGARDATNAPAATTIDPAFEPGFAVLRQNSGFIESRTDAPQTVWQPELQLLVGVKAQQGARKQTVYFVELTALRPPATNAAGEPWSPETQTNSFDWSASNEPAASHHHEEFISHLYPVRIRVFDEMARQLTEGRTTMPWGLLTNGLLDLCRLSLEKYSRTNDAAAGLKAHSVIPAAKTDFDLAQNADLARSMGGGFIWMMIMFGQLQTVPELKEVWSNAHCAFRLPGVWTLMTSVVKRLMIGLDPHLQEVSLAAGGPDGSERWYRLPVELKSNDRKLTSVEIIIGPGSGAELLLAGIRSIRAVHPTRPQQEFLAQVLAAGIAKPTPAAPAPTR